MILLTGASGFIGQHLLNSLVAKYGADNIVAFTSKPIDNCRTLLHNNYNFEPDYFVNSGYAEIETIIHAGSYTPKNGSQANNIEDSNSNILNTYKLLNANLPNLRKFIFLSTLDVYGGDDKVISEDSPVKPAALYGSSKLYCEAMVEKWAAQRNVDIQILRVGHVYGPGEEAYQKIIPVTIRKILDNQPIEIWGTGDEIRSFIYIGDIITAIVNAVERTPDDKVINLVGEQKITIKDLVQKLLQITNSRNEVVIKPTQAKGRDFIFDASRMKAALLPVETKLEVGLEKEWEYMKSIKK